MSYPDDDVMRSMLTMALGVELTVDTGEPVVHLPSTKPGGFGRQPVPIEHIDELVERGWLALVGADAVGPTERGVYWLNRWLKPRGIRVSGAWRVT